MISYLPFTRFTSLACICLAFYAIVQPLYAQSSLVAGQKARQQVLLNPQPLYCTAGSDIPMIYNSRGLIIASQGRPKHFGNKMIGTRLLQTFRLYAMRNRRATGRPRAIAMPSKFGKTMLEIGIAHASKMDLTLTTKMTPVNSRIRTGEGIIDVPKLYAKASTDASQYAYLESLINTDHSDWKMRHPAIHPSGLMVVWSATREDGNKTHDADGTAGADLWYSIMASGSWQFPQKFSSTINSMGEEIFPTFNSDGTILFWSSNRAGSLGGYDLYQANILLPTKFHSPSDTLVMKARCPCRNPSTHQETI